MYIAEIITLPARYDISTIATTVMIVDIVADTDVFRTQE